MGKRLIRCNRIGIAHDYTPRQKIKQKAIRGGEGGNFRQWRNAGKLQVVCHQEKYETRSYQKETVQGNKKVSSWRGSGRKSHGGGPTTSCDGQLTFLYCNARNLNNKIDHLSALAELPRCHWNN